MTDSGVKFVFYGDFDDYPAVGNMFLYSSRRNQLEKLHKRFNPYRTSLVFRGNRIQELQNFINEYQIYEVFVLGNAGNLNAGNTNLRIYETNDEQNFRFQVLCAASRYAHRQEIIEKDQGNYALANIHRKDCLDILHQIKKML